jgi:trans-aconitate 2-methyltransferase
VKDDVNDAPQTGSVKRSSSVGDWYDGFADIQIEQGINIRHRTILRAAKAAGYRDGMRVLEIGCGIGRVTSLLARQNSTGTILALDISPKSVEFAKRNLAHQPNVRFMVSDMSDFRHDGAFDFVVLPDVIEHIPLDQHPRLFKTIAKHMAPNGRVLIHVPCAQLLEHLQQHDAKVLQVIDQPVHIDGLIRTVYEAGLMLVSFSSHGLQFTHTEYHSIVLRPAFSIDRLVRRSKWALRWAELRSRIP